MLQSVEAIVIPAIDNKQILDQPLALWAENKRPPNMVPLIVGTYDLIYFEFNYSLICQTHSVRRNSYEGNLFSYVFLSPTLSYTEQFYDSVWANQMHAYFPPTANATLVKSFYDTIAASEVRIVITRTHTHTKLV